MKRMPDGIDIFYFENLEPGRALFDDARTSYFYYMNTNYGDMIDLGIDIDDVDYIVLSWTDSYFFRFHEGDFDKESSRKKLEESGYYRDNINGIEAWREKDGDGKSDGFEGDLIHAFVKDGLFITGTELGVEKCIDVIKGDAPSLYDNEDFRGVNERLPDGMTVRCYKYFPFFNYERCIVGSYSCVIQDDDTHDATLAIKFESTEAATIAIDKVNRLRAANQIFELGYSEATQDGEFIIITSEEGLYY